MFEIIASVLSGGATGIIGSAIGSFINFFPTELIPYLLLAAVYFITMVLTEIASNVATAIIMTPIALTLSAQFGFDAKPFIFAVCYAASASFITPIGYQTNLMVFGPGGYKYFDYVKVGLPLALILWIVSVMVIPMIWPF